MTSTLSNVIDITLKTVFIYFIVMHVIYFFFIFLGALGQRRHHRGILFGEFKRISDSSLTLPISLTIPAYNEEKLIVNTVLNVLQLRYPQHEVIVVNDGSTDSTLQLLIDRFQLFPVKDVYKKHFDTKVVRGAYRSQLFNNLIVIDKENGGRADANNCAVDHSRYPIICQIDADCVLEQDALLYMIRPFLLDANVIAATAIVKPSNGLIVDEGKIVRRGLPAKWLALYQVIEYLRSFQWSRAGLLKVNSLLCMPGAYTFVRKDIFIKVGGANTKAIIDDFELTVTLQRYIHEHPEDGALKLAFVPDPGCYTEVPEDLRSFATQRNFWQRTILQSLIWNRDMALNPRYGMAGLFGFPYFFCFEVLSPVIETLVLVLAPIAYFMGLASLQDMALLFVFGILLGTLTSVFALLLQERTRLREESASNLVRLLIAGFTDHFGYHQFHMACRLKGIFDLILLNRTTHSPLTRIGHQSPGK